MALGQERGGGAEGDAASRALRRLAALALRVRRPARTLCGSLRAAVAVAAAILGAFLLAEGSMYFRQVWFAEFSNLLYISGGLAFIGAVANIAVVTAILGWGRFAKGGSLSRLLCARLAFDAAYLPLAPVCTIYAFVLAIVHGRWWPSEVVAWEIVRFGGSALLAALLYSLLQELHGSGEEEPMVSWVSSRLPATCAPAPANRVSAPPVRVPLNEEPTPGPAPPPRRPH